MITQDTYVLLRSFTRNELKRLKKFLKSPYFNTNNKVVRLFEDLIRFYPKFTNPKLTKESIYKRIYGKDRVNDSTMRNLFFRLDQLIKIFLAIENLSCGDLGMQNALLKELNLKLLKNEFVKSSKKLDKRFSKSIGTDYDYFYNKYLHEASKFNFYVLHEHRTRRSQLSKQLDTLNKVSMYLTIFFVTETICNYLNASTYYHKYKYIQQQDFTSLLTKYLDFDKIYELVREKHEDDFILGIYISLLKAFTDFKITRNYYEYKASVDRNASKMSPDEVSFHYSRIINYCILKQQDVKESDEFKLELFNVYKVFLEKGYYKDRKTRYLPHNLYRAILFLGLGLKEFSWCKYFINKYSLMVEPQHRENMLYFGQCFYYFYVAQYKKALEYSKLVVNDYFIFKHDINRISLQLNFILCNTEEIYRIIHKYKEALREDELLPDEIKKAHLNFIAYCSKLTDAREGFKKIDIGFSKQKLHRCNNIIQKEWLMKEFDLLIKKAQSNRAS